MPCLLCAIYLPPCPAWLPCSTCLSVCLACLLSSTTCLPYTDTLPCHACLNALLCASTFLEVTDCQDAHLPSCLLHPTCLPPVPSLPSCLPCPAHIPALQWLTLCLSDLHSMAAIPCTSSCLPALPYLPCPALHAPLILPEHLALPDCLAIPTYLTALPPLPVQFCLASLPACMSHLILHLYHNNQR
jgi:hypothetical protein